MCEVKAEAFDGAAQLAEPAFGQRRSPVFNQAIVDDL